MLGNPNPRRGGGAAGEGACAAGLAKHPATGGVIPGLAAGSVLGACVVALRKTLPVPARASTVGRSLLEGTLAESLAANERLPVGKKKPAPGVSRGLS